MKNSIEIFIFCNFFIDKFILLIELLNDFKIIFDGIIIDGVIVIFSLVVMFERCLYDGILGLNFLLHILGDGVFEGCEFDIYLHDLLMREG